MKNRKIGIKLLILMVICIFIYLIYKDTIDDRKINYISLGDGYATGINCYNQKDYGYSKYIEDYLKNNNKLKNHFNDFSYKDAMIKDIYKDILINQHNKNNQSLKQSLRESDLLTLSIGLNDLIYKNSININNQNEIIKEVMIDLDRLIKELKKYYKNDIYIIGYYNFYPQNSVERNLLEKLNLEYKKYSNEEKINYVEIKKIKKYYINPNSIYPNSLGYQEIYKEIIDKIYINS